MTTAKHGSLRRHELARTSYNHIISYYVSNSVPLEQGRSRVSSLGLSRQSLRAVISSLPLPTAVLDAGGRLSVSISGGIMGHVGESRSSMVYFSTGYQRLQLLYSKYLLANHGTGLTAWNIS